MMKSLNLLSANKNRYTVRKSTVITVRIHKVLVLGGTCVNSWQSNPLLHACMPASETRTLFFTTASFFGLDTVVCLDQSSMQNVLLSCTPFLYCSQHCYSHQYLQHGLLHTETSLGLATGEQKIGMKYCVAILFQMYKVQ